MSGRGFIGDGNISEMYKAHGAMERIPVGGNPDQASQVTIPVTQMRVKDLLIELDRLREDEMDTILELINQVPPGPRQAFYEAYPEAITLLHGKGIVHPALRELLLKKY